MRCRSPDATGLQFGRSRERLRARSMRGSLERKARSRRRLALLLSMLWAKIGGARRLCDNQPWPDRARNSRVTERWQPLHRRARSVAQCQRCIPRTAVTTDHWERLRAKPLSCLAQRHIVSRALRRSLGSARRSRAPRRMARCTFSRRNFERLEQHALHLCRRRLLLSTRARLHECLWGCLRSVEH